MDIQQMRLALLDFYSGPSWKLKVSKMSDLQVVAVHRRLSSKGVKK